VASNFRSRLIVLLSLCAVLIGCTPSKPSTEVSSPRPESVVERPSPWPPIEEQLKAYTTVGSSTILLGQTENTAYFVRQGPSLSVGVVVNIGDALVVLREPGRNAPGPNGPLAVDSLVVNDLDRDGYPEILLRGVIGAHTQALWVYHYEPAAKTFKYMSGLAGDSGMRMVAGDKVDLFEIAQRDWSSPHAKDVKRSLWAWKQDHFEEIRQ
jgi:hypothetical protein